MTAGVLLAGTALVGQTPAARVIAMSTTDGLFAVVGDGANSVAVASDDGIILIDTMTPGWGKTIAQKAEMGAEGPITTIINTSAYAAGSTPEFPTAREIIAHENARMHMAGMAPFMGPGAKFLPGRTFKDTLSVPVKTKGDTEGRNRIDLYYLGPARTNGEVIAVLPFFNLAVLGEVVPAKAVPAIDRRRGGSAVALPETVAKVSALLEKAGVRTVVPGHAPPPQTPYVTRWFTLKDVQEYADFTRDILASVTASIQAGKNIDAAVAAFSLPDKYKQYATEQLKDYVAAVYDELGKK